MYNIFNTKLLTLFILTIFFIVTNAQKSDSSNSSSSSSNASATESSSPSKSTSNEQSSGSPSKSSSSPKSSSSVKIAPNAARGMITFLDPPVAQNFVAGWAIGSVAKMKWKFDDNLKIKPNNISIIAIRQETGNVITYNIGLELPGDTTEYSWDMANFTSDPTNPPLIESDNYKLYVYDTARSYLVGAPAGALNPFTRQFRLYKAGNGGSNLCLTCLSSATHGAKIFNYHIFFYILSTLIVVYLI